MAAVTLHAFHQVAAAEIFRDLDAWDRAETEAALGFVPPAEDLARMWGQMADATLYLGIAATQGQAFAIFSLSFAGMIGNAHAALMARDHRRFRRPLAQLALRIRAELPGHAETLGITRIEARSWAPHPTGSRILQALGFAHECDVAGLGPDGRSLFRQWAWVAPQCRPANLTFSPHSRS